MVGDRVEGGKALVGNRLRVLVEEEDGGFVGLQEELEQVMVEFADRDARVVASGGEFDFY